jgi:hypothetical protein
MTSVQAISDPPMARSRSEFAKSIKELMRDWTSNTLALGAELTNARATFPEHPKRPGYYLGFSKWAKQTTGLSDRYVRTLIQVHQKFDGIRGSDRLGHKVMRLLIAKDVPESARIEARDRAARGEHLTTKDAKKIVKAHLPTAKEANQQAKEEGRPVFARDGNIYFGTDAMKAKEGENRRTMIYGVRKALDTLGNINLTGREFLSYALPHQLWDAEEAPIIKKALRWLTMLDTAWDNRE